MWDVAQERGTVGHVSSLVHVGQVDVPTSHQRLTSKATSSCRREFGKKKKTPACEVNYACLQTYNSAFWCSSTSDGRLERLLFTCNCALVPAAAAGLGRDGQHCMPARMVIWRPTHARTNNGMRFMRSRAQPITSGSTLFSAHTDLGKSLNTLQFHRTGKTKRSV